LAKRFLVVAPDLPGLADDAAWAPRSFTEFARWVDQLLDVIEVGEAWIVGNSFGAAVASRVATQAPARCLGLVLVNGGPAPTLPSVVRRLAARGPLRWLIEAVFAWNAYSRSTPRRAFADRTKAPPELAELFAKRRPRPLVVVSDLVLAGDAPSPLPRVPTLLLWGEDDRLMGSSARAAKRLQRSLPSAELVLLPGAGHLPQLERPDEFVRELVRFITGTRHGPNTREPS
jgi:pimeloyl-ACP methyl ester carboxylesterase